MDSKRTWYAWVVVIWIATIPIALALAILLRRLPWHPTILSWLDMGLWVMVACLLAGSWSYETYLHGHPPPPDDKTMDTAPGDEQSGAESN